jgi:hypothetical protein
MEWLCVKEKTCPGTKKSPVQMTGLSKEGVYKRNDKD